MVSRLLRSITDAEVAEFENQGVVCLRGMFDVSWIERIRAALDRVLAEPGPIRIERGDEGGRLAVETYAWRRDRDFRDYAFESPAAAIAARFSSRGKALRQSWMIRTSTPRSTAAFTRARNFG